MIYGLRRQVRDALQLGQYTLDEKIGEGGMGVVYRARHAMLRRPTAIKLLHARPRRRGDLERFEREVQHMSQLTHPNTVAVYDYGRTPDGVFYYAMEYLDGIDLEKLVGVDGPAAARPRRARSSSRCAARSPRRTTHGLIHRDIKPANIILCERGGDAGRREGRRLRPREGSRGRRTNVGAEPGGRLLGTPLYIAPEAITLARRHDGGAPTSTRSARSPTSARPAGPCSSGRSVVEVCASTSTRRPSRPRQARPRPARGARGARARVPGEGPGSPPELRPSLGAAGGVERRVDGGRARAWWAGKGRALAALGRNVHPLELPDAVTLSRAHA